MTDHPRAELLKLIREAISYVQIVAHNSDDADFPAACKWLDKAKEVLGD